MMGGKRRVHVRLLLAGLVAAVLATSVAVGSTFGAGGPVIISVTETLRIADTLKVLPAAMISVGERISIADTLKVLPAAMISVSERISIADTVKVLPAALITVVESITVHDWVALPLPTGLVVGPASGRYSGTTDLQATLTANGPVVSGRTVNFSLNGKRVCGTASTPSCPSTTAAGVATLAGVHLSGLSVSTTPYAKAVAASFAGDTSYGPSQGTADLTVNKGAATLTLSNLNQIYDGKPRTASVTTVPAGLSGVSLSYSQNGSPVVAPTSVGSYTVVASLNDPNYQAADATATLLIVRPPGPCTVTRKGPATGGDWLTPSNWNTGTVPGQTDTTCINDPSAVVTVSHGTSTIDTLLGSGTLEVSGGTLTLAGAGVSRIGQLVLDGGSLGLVGTLATTTGATFSAGTLDGAGVLHVPAKATLTWMGGTMQGLGGTTRIDAGGTLILNGTATRGFVDRTLDNAGQVIWNDGGQLVVSGQGTIHNNRNAVIQLNAPLRLVTGFGNPRLLNAGRLDGAFGTAVALIAVPVMGDGQINVSSGVLDLTAGGELDNGASFGGSGTPRLNGGTFTIPAGSVVTASNLTMAAGIVDGPGVLDVPTMGSLTWTGGTMQGAGGTTRIDTGGTLILNGVDKGGFVDRMLENNGQIVWNDGGQLVVSGQATIHNNTNAVIQLNAGMRMDRGFGNPRLVNQGGSILKVGGATASLIGVPLFNLSGKVAAQIGAFDFEADVSNDGTLQPSASFGNITLNGNFTQASTGTLVLQLGGGVGCTAHDDLIVSGTATVAGLLNVSAVGCTPGPLSGTRFEMLHANNVAGAGFSSLSQLPTGYHIEQAPPPPATPSHVDIVHS